MNRSQLTLIVSALTIILALLTCFPASIRGQTQAAVQRDDAAQSQPLTAYMLELEAVPAARHFVDMQAAGVSAASAVAATHRHLAEIEQVQQVVVHSVEAVGAPILYRTQRVYNGVAVLATPDQIAVLGDAPGVKAVHRIVSKTPALATSVPFIGAPNLWRGYDGALPVRGEGIRIAVIDTGVDYLHVDLGGPGTGYTENNRTIIGDVPGFPNAKIIGGYDFAGETYNADPRSASYNPIPAPDPDPMDCYSPSGHGAHVAGIAAGYGVTEESAAYTGPWDETIDFASLRIGPGVAPLASIYALKVFGCAGSSDIVDLAIEWAVDPNGDGDFSDRVDVINLSLGSPLGVLYDTTTVAAENAAALGVIVVASAGNSGNHRYALGSPSNGDGVISVAATAHSVIQTGDASQERLDFMTNFSSRGPRVGDAVLKPDIAAPGLGIVSAAYQTGVGASRLSGTSMAAPHVAGAMALLRQLHPDWSNHELKALAMNTAFPLVRTAAPVTSTVHAPSLAGAGRVDLAAAARATAVAYAAEHPARVSLGFGAPEVQASFEALQHLRVVNKSGDEARYWLSYVVLTDMPGVTVTLPVTPLLAPAAGVVDAPVLVTVDPVALGRATPPDPGEIIASGRPWYDEESGHLLLWPLDASWSATVTSGAGAGVVAAVYQPQSRTLTYSVVITEAVANATMGGNLARAEITGTLALNAQDELLLAANQLRFVADLDAVGTVISDENLTTQAVILHTPLHITPRAVAAVEAAPQSLAFTDTLTATAVLTGHALVGSAMPTDVVSLASVFQLETVSPDSRPPRLPNTAPDDYDSADISYVGVATNFPHQPNDAAMLYFGIAAHAAWSSPNLVRFDVLIDVDADGAADVRLFNSSREGYATDRFFGDTFVSALERLRSRQRIVQAPLNALAPPIADTRPFESRVMVLPVRVADLKLSAGQTVISYTVESYHRAFGVQPEDVIDRTPPRRFDLANPALESLAGQTGAPIVSAQPGVELAPKLNLSGYALQPPVGILLFHHHNRVDSQVEVVAIDYQWPASIYLPVVAQ
ncbi:MAG: S8 family peptidase [Caldilinea sp.]